MKARELREYEELAVCPVCGEEALSKVTTNCTVSIFISMWSLEQEGFCDDEFDGEPTGGREDLWCWNADHKRKPDYFEEGEGSESIIRCDDCRHVLTEEEEEAIKTSIREKLGYEL